MKTTLETFDQFALIRVDAEKLDSSVSSELKGRFTELASEGQRNFILALGKVKYADSSGLSAILIGHRLSKDNNGILILTELNEMVSKLIRISKLDNTLNQTPTLEEAREAIFMEEIEKDLKNGGEEE